MVSFCCLPPLPLLQKLIDREHNQPSQQWRKNHWTCSVTHNKSLIYPPLCRVKVFDLGFRRFLALFKPQHLFFTFGWLKRKEIKLQLHICSTLKKTMQHNSKSISISKTQVGFYINQYCCQIKRVTYLALGVTTASGWPVSALTPSWYSRFHNQQQRDIQTSNKFSFSTIIKLLPLPGLRVTGWVSIKYGFPLRQPIVRTNGSLVNIAAKFPCPSSQRFECNFCLLPVEVDASLIHLL